MKTGSAILFILLVFVWRPTAQGQDKRVTMSGVVSDDQTHRPIDGATVSVMGNKANPETTDGVGGFTLTPRPKASNPTNSGGPRFQVQPLK
jgi:hypothetical protein